jgi:alcohol dehydrogenase
MKAWRLERLGGPLTFEEVPVPEVRPGSALLRIQASPLLSYLKQYVEGKLPFYNVPQGAFTPGTNGVGVIEAVGRDVWHLKPGQRVVFSPHFVAGENVEDPAQILIGLTAFGAGSAAVQADWRDGSLAEYALAPVATITPADGLEIFDAAPASGTKPLHRPFRRTAARTTYRRRDSGGEWSDRCLRNRCRAARGRDGRAARCRGGSK